ncbi:MAG: hypothetical protein IK108_08505 [Clostridia bacterium]|nr:hypothetical protein [Clostridia bacterium]
MMKRIQKILSVILCIAVLAGALGLSACREKKAKTYLVLGDSIGVGAGIKNPEEANYGRIVANTNGFSYFNDAVNGHTSAKLLARLDEPDVLEHVMGADIISISIGGNDFLKGNLPVLAAKGLVGNYDAVDAVVDTVRENFSAAIGKIREVNPRAVILMQTLYNPIENVPIIGGVYAEGIARLNAVFTDYAADHPDEIEIVDVAAAFSGKSGLIAPDTIHPNGKGNLVIAKAVQEKLFSLELADTADTVVEVQPEDLLDNLLG